MQSDERLNGARHGETQLDAIRDLMVAAAQHGAWLTLGEIAEHTQFGEASISAQLRHLRKPKHGHFCVAKRIRTQIFRVAPGVAVNYEAGPDHEGTVWEYRIMSATFRVAELRAAGAPVGLLPPASGVAAPQLGVSEARAKQLLLCAAPDDVSTPASEPEDSLHIQEESEPCQSE